MEFLPDQSLPEGLEKPKVKDDEVLEVYGLGDARAAISVSQKENSTTLKAAVLSSSDVTLARQLLTAFRQRHLKPGKDIGAELGASSDKALLEAAEKNGTLQAEVRAKPVSASPALPEGVAYRAMHPGEVGPYLLEVEAHYGSEVLAAYKDPDSDESKEKAKAHAKKAMERVVPQGGETPGHSFVLLRDGQGEKVADLWVYLDDATKRSFCYGIEVDAGKRRVGYGRKTLFAWEHLAAEQGAKSLGLNVFAKNTVARHLYISHGFEMELAAFSIDE